MELDTMHISCIDDDLNRRIVDEINRQEASIVAELDELERQQARIDAEPDEIKRQKAQIDADEKFKLFKQNQLDELKKNVMRSDEMRNAVSFWNGVEIVVVVVVLVVFVVVVVAVASGRGK
jgi:hypothetical protein